MTGAASFKRVLGGAAHSTGQAIKGGADPWRWGDCLT